MVVFDKSYILVDEKRSPYPRYKECVPLKGGFLHFQKGLILHNLYSDNSPILRTIINLITKKVHYLQCSGWGVGFMRK